MYNSYYQAESKKGTTKSLLKKCPYSELFWSVFSRIRTEYGEIRSVSLYSVRMRKNTDQNNSEYGHFSGSVYFCFDLFFHEICHSDPVCSVIRNQWNCTYEKDVRLYKPYEWNIFRHTKIKVLSPFYHKKYFW